MSVSGLNVSNSQTLVLLGSARSDSNTLRIVNAKGDFQDAEVIDLAALRIERYEYGVNRVSDDFVDIVEKMIAADVIVFATPVYWYAMSAIMKNFLDRFTDLITVSKPLGRALAGKSTRLLATGSDAELPEGFEVPFRRTSEYFGMSYQGPLYVQVKD